MLNKWQLKKLERTNLIGRRGNTSRIGYMTALSILDKLGCNMNAAEANFFRNGLINSTINDRFDMTVFSLENNEKAAPDDFLDVERGMD